MISKKSFILIFSLLLSCSAWTQHHSNFSNSLDSTDVYYFYESLENLNFNRLQYIDTSLLRFQNYDPSFQHMNYFAGLGNIGHALKPLVFKPILHEGFNYKTSPIRQYFYTPEKTKFYYLIKPYTEAKYLTGPAKEQRLQLIHSQNIASRINFGLDTRFITSPGVYDNLRADDRGVTVNLNYTSKNSRYAVAANYYHDKIVLEESGGIKDLTQFIQNQEVNRRQIPVNLSSSKNTLINGGIQIEQYYNIGRSPIQEADTTMVDSVPVIKETRDPMRLGRITHTVKYERNKRFFEQSTADNSYFENFGTYRTENVTNDSINIKTFENEFLWSNINYEPNPEDKVFYFYGGVKHRITKVYDTLNSVNNSELIPKAGFIFNLGPEFRLKTDAYYIIGDRNDGDKYLSAELSHLLSFKGKDLGILNFKAYFKAQGPDYFYNYYFGNLFSWNNDFRKEYISHGQLELRNKKLVIGISYTRYENFLYMDQNASPKQLGEAMNIASAYLNYIKTYRKWTFDANLIYQHTTNTILSIPNITGHLAVYFTQKFMKDVALIQPGIDVFYNSIYKPDAYMPMTRTFYWQNEQKLGNYAYVDLFMNIRIKRTLFFIKFKHANAGLNGYTYMMVPGYPMPDRGLKFGLSWKFYD